ncbi:MAG: mannose-1-phosphate guanylyltransferase [Caulobacterales bacterium]
MGHKIIPAIMSGGAGSRLWPLSTAEQPKQFHAFSGPQTMIQATAGRFQGQVGDVSYLAPLFVAGAGHEAIIRTQMNAIGLTPSSVVLEPMGRNTAATALLAALVGREIDPEALVLLLPADHVITDPDAFHAAIVRAADVARDRIVTFGIAPSGPETGYGYIMRGEKLTEDVFAIARFREKPDLETAKGLIADGQHYWNAGIFFFAPETVLHEAKHAPAIRDGVQAALATAYREGTSVRLPADVFGAVPSSPFDIAIMEQTDRAAVAPCDIGWADIGSWSELWRLSEKDAYGVAAKGLTASIDSSNCLLLSDGTPIAVTGLSNMIVVATQSGVLVAPMERAQDVKALVGMIGAKTGSGT